MSKVDKIRVKIVSKYKKNLWYEVGEVHEVLNHISFNWDSEDIPYFEKGRGCFGIRISDCEILGKGIPQYTHEELVEKVGHEFAIKDS